MLKEWFAQQDPEKLRRGFYLLQIVAGSLALAVFVWIKTRKDSSSSGFREGGREWQRGASGTQSAPSSQKSATRPSGPALLTGIRIHGQPHEVLGVAADASEETVQQAYRELMKRYHPDKLGRAGSPQWKEAQRIAEAINQARDRMLKR